MRVALILSFLTWRKEFCVGKTNAQHSMVQLSGTVLTLGVDFSIKV